MHYKGIHISSDNIAVAYLLWSLICLIPSTGMHVGIMTGLKTAFLVCAFLIARSIPNKARVLRFLAAFGTLQAILAILQQCGLTESNHQMFKITGFMGNPGQLGGAQAVSLISNMSLYRRHGSRIENLFIILSSAIILYSLVLSDSRAGGLAAIGGIITITHRLWRGLMKRHKWLCVATPCLLCIFILLTYLYRPDSVNARLLIWRVCADMFVDKPLFGFGAYGFNHNYMLYQEEYLSSHPDSIFTSMASDVSYPYNEFIHILIEQGIVGFALFIFMIFRALKECHNRELCAPLVTLLIFAMFSYPSYKLALCMMLPLFLGILPQKPLFYTPSANIATTVLSATTAISCVFGISCFENKLQKRISDIYNNDYEAISYINSSFMQNHNDLKLNAQYATLAQYFPETLSPITIPLIFPSCDNWCTIGTHFFRIKDYANAEKYFTQAAGMAPSLIRPKYHLWKVYLEQGKEDDASGIADEILHMQVKVENTYTLRVRNEILNHKQNKVE